MLRKKFAAPFKAKRRRMPLLRPPQSLTGKPRTPPPGLPAKNLPRRLPLPLQWLLPPLLLPPQLLRRPSLPSRPLPLHRLLRPPHLPPRPLHPRRLPQLQFQQHQPRPNPRLRPRRLLLQHNRRQHQRPRGRPLRRQQGPPWPLRRKPRPPRGPVPCLLLVPASLFALPVKIFKAARPHSVRKLPANSGPDRPLHSGPPQALQRGPARNRNVL